MLSHINPTYKRQMLGHYGVQHYSSFAILKGLVGFFTYTLYMYSSAERPKSFDFILFLLPKDLI